MKIDTVKKFLIYSNITGNSTDNELIEKEYFKDDNYRKVNKKSIKTLFKKSPQNKKKTFYIT